MEILIHLATSAFASSAECPLILRIFLVTGTILLANLLANISKWKPKTKIQRTRLLLLFLVVCFFG